MSPTLKIYNTLSRTKEVFTPIDPAQVRMYVCGPTVYDYAHIGNARPLIVFDVLYRLLRHLYGAGHVKYVRNITDVDDKINARAAERGITIRELTEKTNKVFQKDVRALGCLAPDVQPRATEHIAQMIAIIERLIASGHAYAADGHVLFDVPSMPAYGQLSRRSLEDMRAGARVDVAPYKRGDMDFVLWKPSTANEPGWESPWGRGRPGWHIECSAMSWEHLGETFDIHGGGIDLVFPHHENEIAQSCCAFDQKVMANYWMHNGFLQVEGEKMSKSLGNFITIHELLHTEKFGGRSWPGGVLRLAMLRTHYKEPIDWTVNDLMAQERRLRTYVEFAGRRIGQKLHRPLYDDFLGYLLDDLNTPGALSVLDKVCARESNNTDLSFTVKKCLEILGISARISQLAQASKFLIKATNILAQLTAADFQHALNVAKFNPMNANGTYSNEVQLLAALAALDQNLLIKYRKTTEIMQLQSIQECKLELIEKMVPEDHGFIEQINMLISDRLAARATKNWVESDRIRDELAAMGVVLKDNKDGTTTWDLKR